MRDLRIQKLAELLVNKKPVLALPEETGVFFRNGHVKITGTKPALRK